MLENDMQKQNEILEIYLSVIDLKRGVFHKKLPWGMKYSEGEARGIFHPAG